MKELTSYEMGMPSQDEMAMIMEYCKYIAQAPAYAAMGGMPGVFAVVMSARELGIPPMTALNGGLYLIPPSLDKDGKPKGSPQIMMAAKTMSSMIWKSGHTIEVIEANDNVVTLKGTRADNGVSMTVSMTMEKAKKAGLSHDLYGKPKLWSPWFKNSEDMLWKTCVAKLGRRLFTDVIGNCYEPAEFSEKDPEIQSKEKKVLKGKNISKVENILESPIENLKIEQKTACSFEEFIEKHEIIDPKIFREKNNGQDPNEMSLYIEFSSGVKKVSFDECANCVYENQEKALPAFESWLEKKKKKQNS